MKRRFYSKMIASLPLLLTLPRRALAAPVSSMKEIEELQKSWKTLLADGADIAASAAPLNRPNTEWKKTLSPAAYGAQEHMGSSLCCGMATKASGSSLAT